MEKQTPTVEVTLDPVKAEQELNLIRYKRAFARRNFLKNVGLADAGVAAGIVIQGCGGTSSTGGGTVMAQGPTEADVLNFALNLEYLEAEFYSVAVTGTTLSSTVTGGTSTATGGAKVTFTDPRIADIAAEIAADELLHVKWSSDFTHLEQPASRRADPGCRGLPRGEYSAEHSTSGNHGYGHRFFGRTSNRTALLSHRRERVGHQAHHVTGARDRLCQRHGRHR
jgi:Ferritin-like domain